MLVPFALLQTPPLLFLQGGAAASGSTWTYPSPQMFYNALARKGKLTDDTAEEDIASVVALHNNMNEKTWAKVLQWEAADSDRHGRRQQCTTTTQTAQIPGPSHRSQSQGRLQALRFGTPTALRSPRLDGRTRRRHHHPVRD